MPTLLAYSYLPCVFVVRSVVSPGSVQFDGLGVVVLTPKLYSEPSFLTPVRSSCVVTVQIFPAINLEHPAVILFLLFKTFIFLAPISCGLLVGNF